MAKPHTPTSFKDPKFPILDAPFSVDDEVALMRELFGEMKQPLHKPNDVFDGLHERTTQTGSFKLAGPVGTNMEIANLRQRLSDQDQKHKDVVTEIHGILDEFELLQSQYVANVKKKVEREITEQMDKLVQERVAEYLKIHIPQELRDEVARSNREPPQQQSHPGSKLLHTGLPMSPPSSFEGPSTSTLSHTSTSSVHPAHLSALAHSSNSLGLTSPPPTSSTHSISGANLVDVSSRRFVPQTAAKLTVKRADGTEVSLENLTKSTPTPSTPTVSSPQNLELRQGSSGTPNRRLRSTHMETEDQHKSRLAEQERNYRLKAEAAVKEEKEKEKAEAERKAKVAEEIFKLEEAAQLKKREKKQRRKERKEAEALELQRLKEKKALRLAQDGKRDGQLEDGKDVDNETPMKDKSTKDRLHININSPTTDKRRPRPLDLTLAIAATSRVIAPLSASRFIADIAAVPYPEGVHGPHPNLNQSVKNGKFRYDREFLLQFMPVCKEMPATLPPLDAIGLEPVHYTYGTRMSRSLPGLG